MKSKIKVHPKNSLELVSKTILKFIIVFLFIAQNSFAISKPIPGVGIVVKKNPGTGSITVSTGNDGGFSTQLSEGVYELSFPQDQLQTSINGIVKANYPKSTYQYDGSGVEFVLDNSQIKVNSKGLEGNQFTVDKQKSITIAVPKGGATLSGKLSWNDAVMTNSKICPEGFTMQNGECIPNNISGNQQARTEGKTKGKIIKAGNDGMISVSLNANGGTSSTTGVDTGLSFNPSLGIAIHWKNFGIGLDAGTFNTKPNFDFDAYAAPLQNLDLLNVSNSKSNWSSVYFLIGPHYVFSLSAPQIKEIGERVKPFHNKMTLELAFEGGITMTKAPEFSVTDNSTLQKTIASYKAPDNFKSNVLTLKPSMKLAYWMSDSFAITANAQYLMQSGQEEFTTGYRDLSHVDFTNIQKAQEQILTAPKVISTTKGPEKFMSFGFGITYSISKGWDGSIKGTKTVENTNDVTLRKGWDGSIKGKYIAEKGITENGLKKNEVETTNDEIQRKGIKEQGLKKDEVEVLKTTPIGNTDTQKQRPCECCHEIHGSGYCPKGCDMATSANVVNVKDLEVADSVKNPRNAIGTSGVKADVEEVINLNRKGWDGSIKGIFAEKNNDIMFSKNGGIDKIITKINKDGKSTASIKTYGDKQFIKIVTKEGENYVSEFYPIDTSGPMGIIYGGYTTKCVGMCSVGCELNLAGNCSECSTNPMANCVKKRIDNFGNSWAQISANPILITTKDNVVTVSNGSIKDINAAILTEMPHAVITKSEIVKESGEQYLVTTLSNDGIQYLMFSELKKGKKTGILVAYNPLLIKCMGLCGTTTKECKIYLYQMKYPKCDCTSCSIKIISFDPFHPLDNIEVIETKKE